MSSLENRLEHARRHLASRQPARAERILRTVLRDESEQLEALKLLGRLTLNAKQFAEAAGLLARAVKQQPCDADLLTSLGRAQFGDGCYDEAIVSYRQALRVRPRRARLLVLLGEAQRAARRPEDAARSFQRAIALQPELAAAHYALGNLLYDNEAPNAAVRELAKVIELEPNRAEAYVDLGNALRRCDNDEQAIASYRKALELKPRAVSALNNLSNALRDRGQSQLAVKLMTTAVEQEPRNPSLHNGLGLALESVGRFKDAAIHYQHAIDLDYRHVNAHYNLAGVRQEFGRLAEAEAGYRRALELRPQKAEARFRLAGLRLLQGRFAEAWPDYEVRWQMPEARRTARTFAQPAWDGSDLAGKSILVHAEQGLGDCLQFVRYGQLLRERGARVVLQCPAKLVSLLSRCPLIDEVVADDQGEPPVTDCYAAMMSLPALCGTTLETIPAPIPYLFARADLAAFWKARLQERAGFLVGIAWQGKPTYFRDRLRSIPLQQFESVVSQPGVQAISLQKGVGADHATKVSFAERIWNLGPHLDEGPNAFEETAAVIANLDLVITSDTAIAHLAGALGVPTWIALSYVPEWRWQLGRTDSPWYPTVRAFRQPRPGDWSGAFAQMGAALVDAVGVAAAAGSA